MMDNPLATFNGKCACLLSRATPAAMLLLATLLLTGCSGNDFPDTTPVAGTVTLNSQPVEGALVTFTPKEEDARPASGTTDASGRFELSTYFSPQETAPGAIPGEYQVSVTKMEESVVPEGMTSADPTAFTPPKSLLPKRYANPKESGIEATVTADEPNDFDFELTE